MTTKFLAMTKDVIDILKADTSVASYVADRIYSDVPDNEVFPYITVQISFVDESTKEATAERYTIQLNTYSRKPGVVEVSSITAAIYDALHRQEQAFVNSAPFLVQMNGVTRTVKDTDGATWFSVIQFDAVTSPGE